MAGGGRGGSDEPWLRPGGGGYDMMNGSSNRDRVYAPYKLAAETYLQGLTDAAVTPDVTPEIGPDLSR